MREATNQLYEVKRKSSVFEILNNFLPLSFRNMSSQVRFYFYPNHSITANLKNSLIKKLCNKPFFALLAET